MINHFPKLVGTPCISYIYSTIFPSKMAQLNPTMAEKSTNIRLKNTVFSPCGFEIILWGSRSPTVTKQRYNHTSWLKLLVRQKKKSIFFLTFRKIFPRFFPWCMAKFVETSCNRLKQIRWRCLFVLFQTLQTVRMSWVTKVGFRACGAKQQRRPT